MVGWWVAIDNRLVVWVVGWVAIVNRLVGWLVGWWVG